MKRIDLKRLPKPLRYLLTLRELKEIEANLNFKFQQISSDYLVPLRRESFVSTAYIKCSFSYAKINRIKEDTGWHFSITLNAFRRELLLDEFEIEARKIAVEKIKNYITGISQSKETDLINSGYVLYVVYIKESGLEFHLIEST